MYQALLASCPDKATAKTLTKQVAAGIQHKLHLESGKARFISLQQFDSKLLPLIPPASQIREFPIGRDIKVKCDYPDRRTIVVSVAGGEGGDVQQHQACLGLLVVLWRRVPAFVKEANISAFEDLEKALGPAAGA
jgi:hypothetical protein